MREINYAYGIHIEAGKTKTALGFSVNTQCNTALCIALCDLHFVEKRTFESRRKFNLQENRDWHKLV